MINELTQLLEITAADFDRLVYPIICGLAHWVHILPASERHHHRAAGGLFHHSLDTACRATRACKVRIFETTATPQYRNRMEPRWRVAVGVAGLLHDVAKPITDVSITDQSGGHVWSPGEPLYDWLQRLAIDRYYPRFRSDRKQEHEHLTAAVIGDIIPGSFRDWLFAYGTGPARALYGTLTGGHKDNVVAHLITLGDRDSVKADLLRQGASVESVSLAVPAHTYVLDAMKRLHQNGKWSVNDGGILWFLGDGLYVLWERAVKDIIDVLRDDMIPGIPASADILADILIERSMAEPRLLADGVMFRYHLVLPEFLRAKRGLKRPLPMLKLVLGEDFFPGAAPQRAPAIMGREADDLAHQNRMPHDIDLEGDRTEAFLAMEDLPIKEEKKPTYSNKKEPETSSKPSGSQGNMSDQDLRAMIDGLEDLSEDPKTEGIVLTSAQTSEEPSTASGSSALTATRMGGPIGDPGARLVEALREGVLAGEVERSKVMLDLPDGRVGLRFPAALTMMDELLPGMCVSNRPRAILDMLVKESLVEVANGKSLFTTGSDKYAILTEKTAGKNNAMISADTVGISMSTSDKMKLMDVLSKAPAVARGNGTWDIPYDYIRQWCRERDIAVTQVSAIGKSAGCRIANGIFIVPDNVIKQAQTQHQ